MLVTNMLDACLLFVVFFYCDLCLFVARHLFLFLLPDEVAAVRADLSASPATKSDNVGIGENWN